MTGGGGRRDDASSAPAGRPGGGASPAALAPCPPDTRNCVSSLAPPDDRERHLPPLPYRGSRGDTERRLRGALATIPRLARRQGTEHHWRFEARSLVFRFVDDVEFLFDDDARVVHFRSASRVGRGDLGVNRRRMRRIAGAYARAL